MSNKISIRNKKIAISRWKKVHDKKIEYIKNNNVKYLKSRILGYIAGDGNISVRVVNNKECHHVLRFYPDHTSIIKSFNEAFVKVYDREPIIKKHKNFYCLKVYSKPIVLDLLSYANFGTHTWNVPNTILKDNKSKKEWIRAFFDAESYVGPKHIKLHSVNKNGLDQIKSMLFNDFKIESKIYKYIPKNPKHKTQYSLMIISRGMKERYLNVIGFNHEIKKNKLLNYLK